MQNRQSFVQFGALVGMGLVIMATAGSGAIAQDNTLAVSDRGIGAISDDTPFTRQAIAEALPSFEIREESIEGEGGLYKVIIASKDGAEALRFYGYETVVRADDSDPAIPAVDGIRIGAVFSDVYRDDGKIACEPGMEIFAGDAVCLAPGFESVALILSGSWDGPDGELPPLSVLSDWEVATIIWNAPF